MSKEGVDESGLKDLPRSWPEKGMKKASVVYNPNSDIEKVDVTDR